LIHLLLFQVSPKKEGLLSVIVYDLCLDSPHPATLSIQISDIHSVEVTVASKVGRNDVSFKHVSDTKAYGQWHRNK